MLRVLRVCAEEMEEKRKKGNYRRRGWKREGQEKETEKPKAKREERVTMGP